MDGWAVHKWWEELGLLHAHHITSHRAFSQCTVVGSWRFPFSSYVSACGRAGLLYILAAVLLHPATQRNQRTKTKQAFSLSTDRPSNLAPNQTFQHTHRTRTDGEGYFSTSSFPFIFQNRNHRDGRMGRSEERETFVYLYCTIDNKGDETRRDETRPWRNPEGGLALLC